MMKGLQKKIVGLTARNNIDIFSIGSLSDDLEEKGLDILFHQVLINKEHVAVHLSRLWKNKEKLILQN